MESVISVDELPWRDLTGLAGARGFEFKSLVGDDGYTTAYSCELVRLGPEDHSVPHKEPWNHALYILTGRGEITVNGRTDPIKPGSLCKVKAGDLHFLRNLGADDMVILTIYDPPRQRPR